MDRVICFMCILSIVGCAGDCIKIGGTYNGTSGEIEYCFSKEKSHRIGIPVFSGDTGDLFSFDDRQIRDILDLVKPPGVETKAIKETDPVMELLRILRERKGK